MPAPTTEDDPRHAAFLNLCLLYADFNRPTFLHAIFQSFVTSADRKELAALRRALRGRAKALRRGGTGGRPRAEHDWRWIRRAAELARRRQILRWSWRKIAREAGLQPTKPNIRTLRNQLDRYAVLLRGALAAIGCPTDRPEVLTTMLRAKRIQRWLRSQLALPFDTHPAECQKIVRGLLG